MWNLKKRYKLNSSCFFRDIRFPPVFCPPSYGRSTFLTSGLQKQAQQTCLGGNTLAMIKGLQPKGKAFQLWKPTPQPLNHVSGEVNKSDSFLCPVQFAKRRTLALHWGPFKRELAPLKGCSIYWRPLSSLQRQGRSAPHRTAQQATGKF